MLSFLVIGICLFLLVAVIYISAKPISMGIEARRNLKNNITENNSELEDENTYFEDKKKENISEEIIKLNQLRNDGVLTEEEYEKAKKKILD